MPSSNSLQTTVTEYRQNASEYPTHSWLEARTKDAVFKRIMHERAVELPGEGLRYYDLRRWRLMEKYLNGDVQDTIGNRRDRRKPRKSVE